MAPGYQPIEMLSAKSFSEDYHKLQFPAKLHQMLGEAEEKGHNNVVSWMPGGASFKIHDKEKLANEVMPLYFGSSKHKSFQRSLNLWGFKAKKSGHQRGERYHDSFVRGRPELCTAMKRVRIKGTGPKRKRKTTVSAPPKWSLKCCKNEQYTSTASMPLQNLHRNYSNSPVASDTYLALSALVVAQEKSRLLRAVEAQLILGIMVSCI